MLAAATPLFVVLLGGCAAADDPIKVTTKTPEGSFVDQMVAKTGGDATKLTPEERTKMDQITRGHTELALSGAKKK
ncbi:hypothetical protein BH11ARM2_BH11ARM2_38680 [soil metagenome]